MALIPNNHNQTAFDIAMQNKNERSIDILIQMLTDNPQVKTSHFIQKYIKELLPFDLESFKKYIEICYHQHPNFKISQQLEWRFSENEKVIPYKQGFLGNQFYQKIIGKEVTIINDKQIVSSNEHNPLQVHPIENMLQSKFVNILDVFDVEKNQISKEATTKLVKQIEIKILDFDWCYKGKFSIDFVRFLSNSTNDRWFSITPVVQIINSLWDVYFQRIIFLAFLPFVAYFIIFNVFVLYISIQYQTDKENLYYKNLNIVFSAFILAFVVYMTYIEYRQIVMQRFSYLLSFWNLVDVCGLMLSVAYVILNLCQVDDKKVRVVGAAAIIMIWAKLFNFLKIFSPTASLIRMIVQVCFDIYTFAAVLLLAIIGFGNTFYMLSLTLENNDEENIDNDLFKHDYFLSLIYTFRTGLGDFNTDGYEYVRATPFLWIIFLLCAIIIQIILLNLLIAIMSDTYDKVMEVGEQSKFKEISAMISEYEFLVDREKIFSQNKYLIIAKVVRSDTVSNQQWEGKIQTLRSDFQSLLNKVALKINQNIEISNNSIIAKQKDIENKVDANQDQYSKDIKEIKEFMQKLLGSNDNKSEKV